MRNLNIVFPGMSKKEKKIVLKKMWFHFGRVVGEYPHLNTINIDSLCLQHDLDPNSEKRFRSKKRDL